LKGVEKWSKRILMDIDGYLASPILVDIDGYLASPILMDIDGRI